MARILLFFAKVTLVVLAAVWIAERPGQVTVEWQGWRIDTTVGVLALAALLLTVASALLYRLWRALLDAPRGLGRFRSGVRRDRGFEALTRGLVAVAAGDAEAARKFARKADGLLDDPPLTLLLSAQAAQLNSDDRAARKYFEAMLARPETEFLGLRGLLMQAMRAGRLREATELAQRALALQPKSKWPSLALMELEAREGHWTDAEAALDGAVRAKAMDKAETRRHRAALLTERARLKETQARIEEALELAQQAHDADPTLVPASALLARLKTRSGDRKGARRVLEQAWRAGPHPELAEAWGLAAGPPEGDADPLTMVKRYEALVALDPKSVEGHLALARISIAARLWGEARNHLQIARTTAPTARVYKLLEDLARAERGDGPEAREWQLRHAGADPDPAWICAACGTAHERWSASCHRCGGFDTLAWTTPAVAAVAAGGIPGPLPGPTTLSLPLPGTAAAGR